ncbi:MAG TPA: OmpH family outer membrane protein [bacterium]|nr:OmpH family outer membrane protein [bacterium]HEX67701.1 OmpH family outer membrane protein [bacterium]
MVKRIIFLVFLSVAALTLYSQDRGVVCADLLKVFQSYYKTKEADDYLKSKADELQKEIDVMRGEINDLDKLLKSGILSGEEKAKKTKEMEEKKRALQEKIKNSNLLMMEERRRKVEEILKELQEKVKEFAKKKGYKLIIDKKDVLFAEETVDVTEELIDFVNAGKK